MLGVNKRMGLNKLFGREIIFEEFQRMWSRYVIVTDGQTDGQTKAISISSRGKNRSQGNVAAENELGFH